MLRSRHDEAGYCRYIELIADAEVFTIARKPGITPAFLRFWILYLHDLFLAPATSQVTPGWPKQIFIETGGTFPSSRNLICC